MVIICEMGAPRFVLRNLPGIGGLLAEWPIQNKWSQAYEAFQDRCDVICRQYFGVTDSETRIYFDKSLGERGLTIAGQFYPTNTNQAEEYESEFDFIAHNPFVLRQAVYQQHGWDVSDGQRDALPILPFFERPLLAAILEIAPGVRLPDEVSLSAIEAESIQRWGSKLAGEAAKFQRKR